MINLKSIPFLKILLPYLLGIAIVLNVGFIQSLHCVCVFSFLLTAVTYVVQKYSKAKRYKQWVYLVFLNIFFVFLAQETCWLYQSKHQQNHYSHFTESKRQSFVGTINELPVAKDKYVKIPFKIEAINLQNKWHYTQGEFIIYAKKDSLAHYHLGDKLFLNSTFSYLQEPKNINEFNYKTFLENKNIHHVVYAKPEQIQRIVSSNDFSLFNFGLRIKQNVVYVLRTTGLSQQAFSICSALLVGYDDEIENDVMQSFAHSGTLHILSVSGMHTGLLYGLIIWLFSFFDKHDNRKLLKCMVVVSVLIAFTCITGFTPSVLRASIMLTFIVVGNTFYKNGNNYNTLFLSAFIMLLFNPLLIVDVGFLLSYSAVFGIMYFYPLFQQWFVFDNKMMQWAWNLTLMSVSATITTLPISLLVFHQFPIWFAFSNLLIIPLSTVLMALSAVLLIVSKITFLKITIAYLINTITSLMLWIANLTNNSNYGFIDNISFSTTDALFLVLVILLSIIVFTTKQFKQVVWLCSVIIIWQMYSITINYKQLQEQELVVFHIKHNHLFAQRNGKAIFMDTTQITTTEFNRYVKPYLWQFSGHQLIQTKANYFSTNNTSTLFHSFIARDNNLQATYTIVNNNMPLATSKYNTKQTIIADCSNSYTFVKKLKQQCQQQGISFYDVKEKGMFIRVMNDK